MSSRLVKIPVDFGFGNPDTSIWELSPQLKYYPPYGFLYDADMSENKMFSSRQMWCVVFYNDPDEDINLFFRNSPKERKEKIMAIYGKDIDWDDPLFQNCLSSYPNDCMSLAARALALEGDKLIERAELIRNTRLTFDSTDQLTGKLIKGTALQINTLQKDMNKAYEAFRKSEDLFRDEKSSTQRAYGGGSISPADREPDFF